MVTADQALALVPRTEKRSKARGIEGQLELWPGGGGSAGESAAAPAGGGYQNVRTALRFSRRRADARDPRIDDLRAARVGPVWLRVAERIGFEAFLAVWQTLVSFPGVGDDRNRVYVPCIEKYLQAQRKLLMRELIAQGLSSAQIRQELVRRLGSAPTLDTIKAARRSMRSPE